MILILDFGSQYTQLIAKVLRGLNVYCEIRLPDLDMKDLYEIMPDGIIFSGSPNSVSDPIPFNKEILNFDKPILGLCYGYHLINLLFGGVVDASQTSEYGRESVLKLVDTPLWKGIPETSVVWMSHGDNITQLSGELELIASSKNGPSAFRHRSRPIYGVQFHPEVTHSVYGTQLLSNFLTICGCVRDWNPPNYIECVKERIRDQVGENGQIISLLSGGVDSTVATYLCKEAIGDTNVHPIFIDNGLMREGEVSMVVTSLRKMFINFQKVDATEIFLGRLKGVTDGEMKRDIIGIAFVEVINDIVNKMDIPLENSFLCQGTLYTDLIESGATKHSSKIKTHHNVTAFDELRKKGRVIEPNDKVFKDEVRDVGLQLGIPAEFINRHPFPGPGLAIRILGEITTKRLEMLRKADHIFISILKKYQIYNEIWQAFATFVPSEIVGVMGDQRTVGSMILLRAVTSIDGMTADIYEMKWSIIDEISSEIINQVPGITRVVYDVTSKPPGTIELI